MDEKIIATYCLCDDLLQAMHHHADPQCKMSDAEVMTTALTAALFFRGTLESARVMLKQHGSIPQMLSKSHFSRRLHRLKETFVLLFNLLGDVWKTLNVDAISIIDRLPIAVCDNIRIPRAKLYPEERCRGYLPSKKRYFYGLKVHLLVTKDGQPWSDGTTGITLSPLELLEKLAALVSLPRVHLVRYAGCLAPHSALREAMIPTPRQQGVDGDEVTTGTPYWSWARLLGRVCALDMATCPLCRGGSLRIIAAMTRESVLTRILRHCKLASVPPPIAPARVRQATCDWVASAHDVARGLGGDVCAVARCLRPEEPSKSRLK